MISIMETIQKYVPVQSESTSVDVPGVGEKQFHADWFHHILFGGDMLTAKRARGSQHVRSNSTRGLDRLDGLTPVTEDWHTKVCLMGVSWRNFFSAWCMKWGRGKGMGRHVVIKLQDFQVDYLLINWFDHSGVP